MLNAEIGEQCPHCAYGEGVIKSVYIVQPKDSTEPHKEEYTCSKGHQWTQPVDEVR